VQDEHSAELHDDMRSVFRPQASPRTAAAVSLVRTRVASLHLQWTILHNAKH